MMKTAKSLVDYAVKLKENILCKDPAHKVILFTLLTDIADQLSAYPYHGKAEDLSVIDQLNEGSIRDISVVKKVNRGVNFTGLNNCIVQSYTSSLTDAQQGFFGRMVRLPVEQTAHVHFLVSYYIHQGEKVYCKNADWLSEIVFNNELNYIDKHIVNVEL